MHFYYIIIYKKGNLSMKKTNKLVASLLAAALIASSICVSGAESDAAKKPSLTATAKPTRTPRPTAKPPTPTPKLTNPHKVDLATAQIIGENGGGAIYSNGTINSTMNGITGFIIPSGITTNANKYTHVQIVYTLDGGDVNAYIADGSLQGNGTGQDATGWSPEIKLNTFGTGKEVTVTLGAGQYNAGGDGSVRAIKIFNFGSTTNISIKSITYYMSE